MFEKYISKSLFFPSIPYEIWSLTHKEINPSVAFVNNWMSPMESSSPCHSRRFRSSLQITTIPCSTSRHGSFKPVAVFLAVGFQCHGVPSKWNLCFMSTRYTDYGGGRFIFAVHGLYPCASSIFTGTLFHHKIHYHIHSLQSALVELWRVDWRWDVGLANGMGAVGERNCKHHCIGCAYRWQPVRVEDEDTVQLRFLLVASSRRACSEVQRAARQVE